MASTADALDLITIGRISVDLYAQQVGASITDVTSFGKSIGGTSTNVAVAAARLGHHAACATKVGDDKFGAYARHALSEAFGVDTCLLYTSPSPRDLSTSRMPSSA